MNNNFSKFGHSKKQSGLAMVETTIVLPILLLLLLAISEFGRAFYTYNSLNKFIQSGARHLSSFATPGGGNNIVLDTTAPNGNAYLTSNLIVYGSVNSTGEPLLQGFSSNDLTFTNPAFSMIKVSADYNYVPMVGEFLSLFGFGDPIDLRFTMNASVTMRVLQ